MAPIVLFNIGWMTHYCGDKRSDRIINAESTSSRTELVARSRTSCRVVDAAWAMYNSQALPSPFEHLGTSAEAAYVDGATVVYSATSPGGGGFVVGWYLNARVWREHQPHRPHGYIAEAEADDCTLLDVDDRVFRVPRARGGKFGLGQSNVRYLHASDAVQFVQELR